MIVPMTANGFIEWVSTQPHHHGLVGSHAYLPVWVAEHVHEPIQQLRQMRQDVQVRDAVKHTDPADQELALVWVYHTQVVP